MGLVCAADASSDRPAGFPASARGRTGQRQRQPQGDLLGGRETEILRGTWARSVARMAAGTLPLQPAVRDMASRAYLVSRNDAFGTATGDWPASRSQDLPGAEQYLGRAHVGGGRALSFTRIDRHGAATALVCLGRRKEAAKSAQVMGRVAVRTICHFHGHLPSSDLSHSGALPDQPL